MGKPKETGMDDAIRLLKNRPGYCVETGAFLLCIV